MINERLKENVEAIKVGVVVSRFNGRLVKPLTENFREALLAEGIRNENTTQLEVPGAIELPYAASQLIKLNRFDVIVVLGLVIRGETPHFDYVCGMAADGINQLNLTTDTPVIFGVLTTDTVAHAENRVSKSGLNKGKEFAESAIEMAIIKNKLQTKP